MIRDESEAGDEKLRQVEKEMKETGWQCKKTRMEFPGLY
jgi:hypothetical protein